MGDPIEPLTPIQRKARMAAQALTGTSPPPVQPEPQPYDDEIRSPFDADVLGAIGGSLAGLGGRSVHAMSQDLVHRSDALRNLVARRRLPKSQEELDNLAASAAFKRFKMNQPPKAPKDTSFGDATDLRKEVTAAPETKAFNEVEAQFQQMSNAANNATGDVARIYALAKIFDPGALVTKSDYEAAKIGQGPLARYRAYINEIEGSGILSEQTRANMLAEAKGLYERRKQKYQAVSGRYRTIAKKRGLDPEDVVVRPVAPEPAGDVPPPAGLDPARKARLEELRRKKAAGEIK